MPVNLEWHPDLPVLQITYTGILTTEEYQAMRKQARKMLDAGPDQVIVMADVRAFESFPTAGNLQRRREPIVSHPKVYRLLVVVGSRLMQRLSRATLTDLDRAQLRVFLFDDPAGALDAARQFLR